MNNIPTDTPKLLKSVGFKNIIYVCVCVSVGPPTHTHTEKIGVKPEPRLKSPLLAPARNKSS